MGKAPKQKKKESDTAFETRMREYRAQCHQLCVYKTAQLAGTARKRDLLLDLVADYHAEKRALNMAEFSDFTIAAFQLVTRFPSIGATYRKRYTHVLLDEYQDTSTTQAALLTALFHADSTHRSAVNAVGDPLPIDLRMARSQPRRIPHAATRLRPRRHRQALHADRHPT